MSCVRAPHIGERVKFPLDDSTSYLSHPNWPLNHNLPFYLCCISNCSKNKDARSVQSEREYTSGPPPPRLPGSHFKGRDKIVPFSSCFLPNAHVLYLHRYDSSHYSVLDTSSLNPGNVYTLETLKHLRIKSNALAKAVAG